MRRISPLLSILFLFITTALAEENTLSGVVTEISDGDTLVLLSESNARHKVRLSAIDAPEKSQPFGQKAKQALSDLCYKKAASVLIVNTDRYGRSVGEVTCDGRYANEVMLSQGMAWVYRKHAEGYAHFYRVEEAAKAQRQGLWKDANPIPPWDYRKLTRQNVGRQ
jgi:endonuclease YncB( thermonuclease family)